MTWAMLAALVGLTVVVWLIHRVEAAKARRVTYDLYCEDKRDNDDD